MVLYGMITRGMSAIPRRSMHLRRIPTVVSGVRGLSMKPVGKAMSVGGTPIPVVDFGEFDDTPSEKSRRVADEVMKAAKETGFFYLVNHGMPTSVTSNMFSLAHRFFATPAQHKEKYRYDAMTNTGWLGIASEKLDPRAGEVEWKEAVNMCRVNMMGEGKRREVDEMLLGEAGVLEEFNKQSHHLLLRLLRAFALALQIPASEGGIEYFTTRHAWTDPSGETMRMLWYPPPPNQTYLPAADGTQQRVTRGSGHTDYGSLTLLWQDEAGGLEALLRDSEDTVLTPQISSESDAEGLEVKGQTRDPKWISLPPIPNATIVNVGDLMEFWTDGVLTSTPHRVVFPTHTKNTNNNNNSDTGPARSRYSVAFFGQPSDTTPLSRVPSPVIKSKIIRDQRENTLFRGPAWVEGEKRAVMTAREYLMMCLSDIH
ncbi:hypothetical protein BC832DRAFT_623692 [Gaertneriomyces semiglobifer]|nr:hypothetical protein BC832DRAFT_623692 [Gaertneriomyces semiglobifer]